jgi:O-antigen/teichoic acid export membrane protein
MEPPLTKWLLNSLSRATMVLTDTRRRACSNAFYGVVDYMVQPVIMLIAAPFLLSRLGLTQYGVWMLASAAVSSGGMLSGSFGDAAIKYIAVSRSKDDELGVKQIVRNTLSINLILGGAVASILWLVAPLVTRHIVQSNAMIQLACLRSLRLGSLLLITKSIESVFICALRAYETYGPSVRIGIYSRVLSMIFTVFIVWLGGRVVGIMVVTLLISMVAVIMQGVALRKRIGSVLLLPSWHRQTISTIAGFGGFSWLQALSGIVFGQLDRFLIGIFMGAPAVACYGLCIQAAQPIHGLISSGMHFIFPHLSSRYPIASSGELKRKLTIAFKVNIALVMILSLPLVVFGKGLLSAWLGAAVNDQIVSLFPEIVAGFALLGVNVTGHYALLAIGKVRLVTFLNLLAGTVMLAAMVVLLPRYGLKGAAEARLLFGPITWVMYYELYRYIWRVIPMSSRGEYLPAQPINGESISG